MERADADERLVTIPQAAKEWQRRSADLYKEIEEHDYREEQGVFFRHLERRAWRINRFQYLYWRRLPVAAASDVQVKAAADFLLQHLEPAITALVTLRRYLQASHEAAALRIEQQVATNHDDPVKNWGGGRPDAGP